jgi:hypothetical protein
MRASGFNHGRNKLNISMRPNYQSSYGMRMACMNLIEAKLKPTCIRNYES